MKNQTLIWLYEGAGNKGKEVLDFLKMRRRLYKVGINFALLSLHYIT
jgi:hypothetical protein